MTSQQEKTYLEAGEWIDRLAALEASGERVDTHSQRLRSLTQPANTPKGIGPCRLTLVMALHGLDGRHDAISLVA